MATPALTPATLNVNTFGGEAVALSFKVKDSTGAPVDISSGYSAVFNVWDNNTISKSVGHILLSPTYSFGVDGTLGMTFSPSGLNALKANQNYPFQILLSNDGGTTLSIGCTGTMALSQQLN